MMVWSRALVIIVVACAASACQSRGPLTASDLEGLAGSLRQRAETGYAAPFRAGRVAEWAQIFAADAVAYHDGPPPLRGRDAIIAFGELVHQNFEIRKFEITVNDVRAEGNWALTGGHYVAHFVPRSAGAYAAASGVREGKFLFVWQRIDGNWLIVADMGNSTDRAPQQD